MKKTAVFTVVTILAIVAGLNAELMAAEEKTYEVTITNLTPGQVMTPPLLATHKTNFSLFTIGKKASKGLATLAEEGDTSGLSSALKKNKRVMSVATGDAVIMPGKSTTITITTAEGYRYLSMASMFAVTNDAFAAVRGVWLADGAVYYANVYDAGSEGNNESADFIPGLGSPGARYTKNKEGYVHISNGVHGHGDLDPAAHDWRNPGAMISIKEVK